MHTGDRAPFAALRVGGCALVGALALSTSMSFVQGYRWLDRTSETGGIAYNLVWFVLFLVENLIRSPWGLLGALAGAAVAWRWTRRRSAVHRD